jgi:hypothetical protein
MPHATHRGIVGHLTRAEYPITLHGLNHLCAVGEGPPPVAVWAGRYRYDVHKAMRARARFRPRNAPITWHRQNHRLAA